MTVLILAAAAALVLLAEILVGAVQEKYQLSLASLMVAAVAAVALPRQAVLGAVALVAHLVLPLLRGHPIQVAAVAAHLRRLRLLALEGLA